MNDLHDKFLEITNEEAINYVKMEYNYKYVEWLENEVDRLQNEILDFKIKG